MSPNSSTLAKSCAGDVISNNNVKVTFQWHLNHFLLAISKLIKIILDKIIDYDLEEGKKTVKENDLERGLRFYKNVIYIAEKLGKTEICSEMCKKISDIYDNLGDTKLSESYLGKYKEILYSVKHLPENFKDNAYYAEYFSISDEYCNIIQNILQKPYSFSDLPIIIIPIERIFDARKFEKIIFQRNFHSSKQ